MGHPTYEGLAAYWAPLDGLWSELSNRCRSTSPRGRRSDGAGRAGTRPFQGDETVRLRLLEATSYDSGVTLLRYALAESS
jgi:hypothetical protein